jgi:hypothetical protein
MTSGSPPPLPGWDTGDRLRAALSARSAQVGPVLAQTQGSGPPPNWQPTGYTRAEAQSPAYSPAYSSPPRPGGGRPTFLGRWAKVALAGALALSAVLGVGLGLHSSASSTSTKLPPPRETSYGSDRARVTITSFTRQAKFVTLELELTNLAPLGSDSSWSVNNAFADSSNYDLSGIRLVDPDAGTSSRPAEDAKGDCICTSTISLTIAAGSSSRVSAQFPAPASSVKKLNVDIPGAGSFPDVPLG